MMNKRAEHGPMTTEQALRVLGREFWAWLNHPFTLVLMGIAGIVMHVMAS